MVLLFICIYFHKFPYIPINSNIFPLIPMEIFHLWIYPKMCDPTPNWLLAFLFLFQRWLYYL